MKVFENKLRIDLNDNTSLKFYLCNKLKKDRMVFYDDEINFQEEVFLWGRALDLLFDAKTYFSKKLYFLLLRISKLKLSW